ncbi:hypothetical protein [Lentzea sp. NPDC004782]
MPAHPISHVSEIERTGPIAAAPATARPIGGRVPPVVVIAPEIDR